MTNNSHATYILGDLHGCYNEAVALLLMHGVIDNGLSWCAGQSTLCCMGDYVDHGPDGLQCIDLVMRLEREAAAAGGRVIALLGNHEVLLLAAHRLGQRENPLEGKTFEALWRSKEGAWADLAGLTEAHVTWLSGLPAVVRLGEQLLLHADAPFYLDHGSSIDGVNRAIASVLAADDSRAWARLIEHFSEHHAFRADSALVADFLRTLGGSRIIHGHTPLCKVLDQPMHAIAEPLVYADGLCVNVDHGLYLDGPGFVYTV